MPHLVAGRITKIRKHGNNTPHRKHHRWEPFSTKISKLNSLDPLRKVRRNDLDHEDLSVKTSYFHNGVIKWADLNMSKHFRDFKREILPLCETLPQILHFQDRIMHLLATYISAQEKEAMEPLLDLLVAFAHDLGAKFEKYYQQSLNLLISIAGKPQEVEVIEWTFGALAWLFKYLSKLLVPDLRPTYNMLSGLLGKTKHPNHINRFAAESLSFLIKKAAAPSCRRVALPRVIEYVRDDIQGWAGNREGVMTMFAAAMKGPGHTLHSAATSIFAALLSATPPKEVEPGGPSHWTEICCGVLTNIIHHSTAESFIMLAETIVQTALQIIEGKDIKANPHNLLLFMRLFGIMAGVRSGSRISDWVRLIKALTSVLEALSNTIQENSNLWSFVWENVVANAAVCWVQAPLSAIIPASNDFNRIMTREPLMAWYIPFCSYLAKLNGLRFRSLFQKPFEKFIAAHWSRGRNDELLCLFLPKLVLCGALPPGHEKESCPLPQSWQDQIVSKFEGLGNVPFPEEGFHGKKSGVWRNRCLPKYAAFLRVLESTSVHPSTNARTAELLLKKLKLALRPSDALATDETHFIVTQGFLAYLRMSKASDSVDESLSPLLKAAAPRFSCSPTFLEAFLGYEKHVATKKRNRQCTSPPTEDDSFTKSLIENLASSSRPLRMASLRVFEVLSSTPGQHACLATMMLVEQLPLDHQSPRTIAMHLRRLCQSYDNLDENNWLKSAIPAYLFGMMTLPLAPVWDDAVESLKHIAQSKPGEQAVADRAFEWLKRPSARWDPTQLPSIQARGPISNFKCSHLLTLEETAQEIGKAVQAPLEILLQGFEDDHAVPPEYAANARAKALRILSGLASLAEKRSRKLVPLLLTLNGNRTADVGAEDETDMIPTEHFWSLADKKALIGVFAQFANPRVLYRSPEVYETLLGLVANRDAEIQKLALKAVLTWKQEGVKPYKENLEFLLDDARFKNELTVFLQDDSIIQSQHRAELMPVLLRILYGRATSKKGVASGRNGLHATRLAVIRNLSLQDIGGFLDIALGNLRHLRIVDASGLQESVFREEKITARQLVGSLNMVESIINELGTGVEKYMDSLVNAVLYCLILASRRLRQASQAKKDVYEDVEEEQEEDSASIDGEKTGRNSHLRVARTTSLKCLCALTRNNQSFDWSLYQEIVVTEVVTPAMSVPIEEMAQGISWAWRLLETWSLSTRTSSILAINKTVITKIVECVSFEKSKDEVRLFAVGIVQNLVKLAQSPDADPEFDGLVRAELLDPNADKILSEISIYLRSGQDIQSRVLETCIDAVVNLSSVVDGLRNARNLVDISIHLLNQPVRQVSPKIKGSLLLILERYIALDDIHKTPDLKQSVYETLVTLFSFFKDRRNRQSLCRVLIAYATREPTVHHIAQICKDLNSYVEERLDEPDYDRRLAAFNAISPKDMTLTIQQWMPLLRNMVFYLNHDQEFGILSSNSVDGICKFINAAALSWGRPAQVAHIELVNEIIMPAIQAGVREPSETVRRETMRLLGHLADKLSEWTPVSDISTLRSATGEESNQNFLTNILTLSVSKQLQAVQLLVAANEKNELSSKNIGQIFLPLLEHFIWGRAGADDHGLGAQATTTIASLSGSLEWPQYRALLRRYISYLQSKPDLHKQVIRLLDKTVEKLVAADESRRGMVLEAGDSKEFTMSTRRRLSRSLPAQEKFEFEFSKYFLPPLLEHINSKDEETVSARVPVALIVVKLLRLLPDQILSQQLPSLLTNICHILRSKAWESREMARNSLARIACVLGPQSFRFILTELRGALKMGTQLHVLSYTMHTILLAVAPEFSHGDIDYCLEPMVSVVMDDIFGVTGQEKDSEGYVSKMKEVKSSKSQDSMELIASTTSITHLVDLVKPLQALLSEKIDLRMVRKIDELLNRIASGLQKNPTAGERDTLVFCYEVIQEVYNSQKPQTEHKIDPRLKRYLVQKGAKREDRGAMSKHTYKLMRFAFDILRSVLRKNENLRVAGNINGFLPILGDAIVAGEEEVKIAALKLLTTLVKVPSKTNDLNDLYRVASKDAIKSISQAVSTTTDLSQTALKFLAVILRDRREIMVKDAAVDLLLAKLKHDLTQPLYRHITFNFLRSVLDRKIETAVVYDTLDYVGTVMITNDDKDTRDLARGAFFQFLCDYPQKRSRWNKQTEFIIANLKYPREGGRISVMEVVHLLLTKSANDFVKETAAIFFYPLVLVLGNDDSERCRLGAAELIKEIFRKADKAHLKEFLARMRSWAEQGDNLAVVKLAFQMFAFYCEARESSQKDSKDLNLLIGKAQGVLEEHSEDWDLVGAALHLVHILIEKHPERLLSDKCRDLWNGVVSCMSSTRLNVQLSAVKLLAKYLTDFASSSVTASKGQTITGSYGQTLDQDQIVHIIHILLGTLRGLEVDETLALDSVQILTLLAPFLNNAAANEDESDLSSKSEDEEGGRGDEKNAGAMTIRHIFFRLAAIIRRETPPKATALASKIAAMKGLEVFCINSDLRTLEPSIRTILRPLRNLTDASIPVPFSTDELFKIRYEKLQVQSQQIMDTLQQKLGTANYSKQLLAVGEDVRERRQARSSKRKVEAITAPEKWGKEKRKKMAVKKDRRKAKGLEHRSLRRGF